jgi:hypothetical protein
VDHLRDANGALTASKGHVPFPLSSPERGGHIVLDEAEADRVLSGRATIHHTHD